MLVEEKQFLMIHMGWFCELLMVGDWLIGLFKYYMAIKWFLMIHIGCAYWAGTSRHRDPGFCGRLPILHSACLGWRCSHWVARVMGMSGRLVDDWWFIDASLLVPSFIASSCLSSNDYFMINSWSMLADQRPKMMARYITDDVSSKPHRE